LEEGATEGPDLGIERGEELRDWVEDGVGEKEK